MLFYVRTSYFTCCGLFNTGLENIVCGAFSASFSICIIFQVCLRHHLSTSVLGIVTVIIFFIHFFGFEMKNNEIEFFIRCVPESARWLVIRGRVSEAEDILLDIALKNGIAIPKSLIQVNRPFHIGSRYGCLDLFCRRRICKITFILICIW